MKRILPFGLLALLLFAFPAFADSGSGTNLDPSSGQDPWALFQLLFGVGRELWNILRIAIIISGCVGLGFVILGLLKIRQHALDSQNSNHLRHGIILLILGGLFFSVPLLSVVSGNSLFGSTPGPVVTTAQVWCQVTNDQYDQSTSGCIPIPTCGSQEGWTGNACKPCGPNQVVVDNTCVSCQSNQVIIDGTCSTCPNNQIIVNGACASCPNGQVVINGACASCPNDQVIINGACASCPNDQVIINGACASCPSNQIIVNGACASCPDGQIVSNGACTCPSGQIFSNGACVNCIMSGNACVPCPANRTIAHACCPEGQVAYQNSCISPASLTYSSIISQIQSIGVTEKVGCSNPPLSLAYNQNTLDVIFSNQTKASLSISDVFSGSTPPLYCDANACYYPNASSLNFSLYAAIVNLCNQGSGRN